MYKDLVGGMRRGVRREDFSQNVCVTIMDWGGKWEEGDGSRWCHFLEVSVIIIFENLLWLQKAIN